jgi:hypothetical protein
MNIDAGAALAGASPAIFDAGASLAINVDGSFGACALAQYLCVEDGDREEYYEREKHPPWREGIPMEREPRGDEGCDDKEEADISEAAVHLLEVLDSHLAGLLAFFVLF